MTSVYLVITKSRSNHIKIMGAFENEKLAEIFCHQKDELCNLMGTGLVSIQKFNLMDNDPEFIKTLI